MYPDDDRILALCSEIREEVGAGIQPSELGGFLQAWNGIESRLLTLARLRRDRVYSALEAIRVLEQAEKLPINLSQRLNALRQTRNTAVHQPEKLEPGELASASSEISSLLKQLKDVRVEHKVS